MPALRSTTLNRAPNLPAPPAVAAVQPQFFTYACLSNADLLRPIVATYPTHWDAIVSLAGTFHGFFNAAQRANAAFVPPPGPIPPEAADVEEPEEEEYRPPHPLVPVELRNHLDISHGNVQQLEHAFYAGWPSDGPGPWMPRPQHPRDSSVYSLRDHNHWEVLHVPRMIEDPARSPYITALSREIYTGTAGFLPLDATLYATRARHLWHRAHGRFPQRIVVSGPSAAYYTRDTTPYIIFAPRGHRVAPPSSPDAGPEVPAGY